MWVLFIPLFACNEKSEVNITETRAVLVLDVEIENDDLILKTSKSVLDNQFSGFCTFCLSDSKSIENCSEILRIGCDNGSVLSLSGVDDLNELESLNLKWGYLKENSGEFKMHAPLSLMMEEAIIIDGKTEINMDDIIPPLLKQMNISPMNQYKIEIQGASAQPISGQIKIPLIIHSGRLTSQFSLF